MEKSEKISYCFHIPVEQARFLREIQELSFTGPGSGKIVKSASCSASIHSEIDQLVKSKEKQKFIKLNLN